MVIHSSYKSSSPPSEFKATTPSARTNQTGATLWKRRYFVQVYKQSHRLPLFHFGQHTRAYSSFPMITMLFYRNLELYRNLKSYITFFITFLRKPHRKEWKSNITEVVIIAGGGNKIEKTNNIKEKLIKKKN